MLFDLKTLNSALEELEQEKGVSKEQVLDAIEHAFAAAYKKEYGKKGQIIRARFDKDSGDVVFSQVKIVVDDSAVYMPDEELADEEKEGKTRFNPESHIMLEDAKRIKSGVELDDEIEFPLEAKEEFGRIAAQTAKQVIMQKIRFAEREATVKEYGARIGEVVTGFVQRFERGSLYVDLGRAVATLPYEEQIPGERYRQGERIRALLYKIDPEARGSFIKLSRTRPEFLVELFKLEAPELETGVVEVKAVAREAGKRSKIAVYTEDDRIDPVGTMVGQRGVRVSTVTSELGGEKIDIIEWSPEVSEFVARSLSPAEVLEVELDEENKSANITVAEDQQSLAIGRGGQNVRLASKLTGWKINIKSVSGDTLAVSDGDKTDITQEEFTNKNTGGENEMQESADTETVQEAENTQDEKDGFADESGADVADDAVSATGDDTQESDASESGDGSGQSDIPSSEEVDEQTSEDASDDADTEEGGEKDVK